MSQTIKDQNLEIINIIKSIVDTNNVPIFKSVSNNIIQLETTPYCIVKMNNVKIVQKAERIVNFDIDFISMLTDKSNETRKYDINIQLIDLFLEKIIDKTFNSFDGYDIDIELVEEDTDIGLLQKVKINFQTLVFI